MLFKHFEVKGGADRVLIYLTLYVTQCLKKLEGCATQVEALKALTAMAHEMFKLPGEPGFPLGSFFPSASSTQEAGVQLQGGGVDEGQARAGTERDRASRADLCRAYLKQLREELGRRLIGKVYATSDGGPSKFWIVFAKRRFMNKQL